MEIIGFILDGVTYKAIEDPDDGYRSFCTELQVCDEVISNKFPTQKVRGSMKECSYGAMHEIPFSFMM